MKQITADEILQYCLNGLDGTVLVNSWGERGIFYNPNNKLKSYIMEAYFYAKEKYAKKKV